MQHFPRQHHEVGVLIPNGFLGLLRVRDHPAHGGRDFCLMANTARNRDHEARPPRNLGNVRCDKPLAHIHEIKPGSLEPPQKFDGFLNGDAALDPVRDRQPGRQRESFRPDFANGGECLQHETNPLVETAAILVGSVVGERREELVGKVAVGEMQFQPLETRRQRPLRCGDEGTLNLTNILDRHRPWHFRKIAAKGHGGWGNGVPTALVGVDVVVALPRLVGAGLAPGVGKLDAGASAMLLQETGDFGERLNVVIEIDATVGGTDATFR